VESIQTDGFDCTYAEWVERFGASTLAAQSLDPYEVYPRVELDDGQREMAEAAAKSGEPIGLDSQVRIVLRGGRWRIMDNDGCVLMDLNESFWCPDDDDEDADEALSFASLSKAMEAYLRHSVIGDRLNERRRAAYEALGRSDDRRSC
jgi:hypothetical protein